MPYKVTALAIPDVIARLVQLLIDAIASGMPHFKNTRLRALAVMGDKRSALAPQLPTIARAGFAGFSYMTWFGSYAPRGVKPELAAHAPDVVKRAWLNLAWSRLRWPRPGSSPR